MAHKVVSVAGSLLFQIRLQETMEEFGDMGVASLSREELDDLLEKYSDEEAMVVDYDGDIYKYWNKETVIPSKEELEEILKEFESETRCIGEDSKIDVNKEVVVGVEMEAAGKTRDE